MAVVLDFNGGDLRAALAAIAPPVPRGSIYVVAFSSNIVKVGRTQNPIERMTAHAAEAARHGHHVTRAWVSPIHEGFAAHEKALKDWCAEAGEPVAGREYFEGLAVEAVIEFAMRMVGNTEELSASPSSSAASTEIAVPRLRTLDEAAQESGLPLAWLREACRKRRVTHIRCGHAVRLTPDQITRASEVFWAPAA